MNNVTLSRLTEKQRTAWQMRFRYGWRMERIAVQMGIKQHAVTKLLQRAQLRVGLPWPRRIRVIRAQPRLTSLQSLSRFYNY